MTDVLTDTNIYNSRRRFSTSGARLVTGTPSMSAGRAASPVAVTSKSRLVKNRRDFVVIGYLIEKVRPWLGEPVH